MEEKLLIVKIVTAEKFKNYQGFDLANFDQHDVHTYKIQRTETYDVFKKNISQTFNLPLNQIRFWVLVYRQNKTIRPDIPIPESYSNKSMEEIRVKMIPRHNEMKLYIEKTEEIDKRSGKTWFPSFERDRNIIVFLKYFDPDKQTFEGLGHLYVKWSDKVGDYANILRKRKNLSPKTPLKIYEEVKPNMIDEMDFKYTFKLLEIQNGDIICFQKVLSCNEIKWHIENNRIYDIPTFYGSIASSTVTVNVVTAKHFKKHQGFDLVNFVKPPLSKIYSYKILTNTNYDTFKENLSRFFNIPSEQMRFWIFIKRQNQTFRLDFPIPESYFKKSMKEIREEMVPRMTDLKLYMEVADKKINDKIWFPSIERNENMIVFLKYFDPDTQTLEGLGHFYVRMSDKLEDYTHVFYKSKKLPLDIPLKIYEEIKPNMIEEMNLKYTFSRLGIQNGDIICFQKALIDEQIIEYTESGRIYSIPQFYESLNLLTVVSFKPEWQDWFEFGLILSKKSTCNQVIDAVALHLNVNPFRIQFTNTSPIFDAPNQTFNQGFLVAPTIYYEILDANMVESNPERPKFFKIIWLGNTVKDEEIIDIHLHKDAIISEIIKEILGKVTLSSPDAKIRLYEVMNHKIQKEYEESELIGKIDEFMTLYAEEISQDELFANPKDRIIQGETFTDIKIRLQLRLGMNKTEFAKIRIAIVSEFAYNKPKYLKNDGIILSKMKLSNTNYLGLDHVDETESKEKITYIRS
ncbi:cysteine proteinase [Rhizophagus clarus]|uniref:ubiquitinyl hydrolase 1 n=1 Tax=Rhizophagus clarus TaxID=94130 RepID=A0A8H3LU13_9GLOM|nr:cysteine proteinase [Rhizophagus clarus]